MTEATVGNEGWGGIIPPKDSSHFRVLNPGKIELPDGSVFYTGSVWVDWEALYQEARAALKQD